MGACQAQRDVGAQCGCKCDEYTCAGRPVLRVSVDLVDIMRKQQLPSAAKAGMPTAARVIHQEGPAPRGWVIESRERLSH